MTRAALISFAALVAITRLAVAQASGVTSETQSPDKTVATPAQSARALLEQYVRMAVAKSPELGTIRARSASAREQVAPAGALPDPMVGIMYQSMGAPWRPMAPMSMVQGEISQMIPGVGKR